MQSNRTSRVVGILVTVLLATQTSIAPAAEWKVGDKVVTTVEAPVMIGTETLTAVPKGTELVVEAVEGDWIAVTVERGGKEIIGWVDALKMKISSRAAEGTKRIEVGTFVPTKPRWLGENTILCDVGAAIHVAPGKYVPSCVSSDAFDMETSKSLDSKERKHRAQAAKTTLVVSVRRSGTFVVGRGYRDLKSYVHLRDLKADSSKEVFSCSEEIDGACVAPDGRKVAFCRTGHLWVLNLPDEKPKQLTSDRAIRKHPVFGPDGNSVYFVQEVSGKREVYALDVASGEQVRITADLHPVSSCAVSPDGKLLAVSSAKGIEDQNEHAGNIWLVDLATKDKDTERISSGNADQFPSFSPSGQFLAFQRQEGHYRDSNMPAFNVVIEELSRSRRLPADRKHGQSASAEFSIGMTKQEVKQIAGAPKGGYQKMSPDIGVQDAWEYGTFTVWFDNKGKLTRVEKR